MQEVDAIHQLMREFLANYKLEITDIAVCPHHPEIEKCLCRKPSPLMIEKLMAKYRIDPTQSFSIGDSDSDMQAAQAAGVRGIQITANQSMKPFLNFL